jgi:hypothetical protein
MTIKKTFKKTKLAAKAAKAAKMGRTMKKMKVAKVAKVAKMNNPKTIYNQLVVSFIQMLNTVKLYHWKTVNYATHKATDQLYADLNSKVDEFVEVLLGKTIAEGQAARSFILNVKYVQLTSFQNNNDFKREIEKYKAFMINLTFNPQLSHPSNSDLLAIRDEILALLNQFLYLLTLQ